MEIEKKKLAYLPMAVDMIHNGHLNIINIAASLDATVMVGCYSDAAIASYKRLPFMNYEQRSVVVGSIKGVDVVVEQRTYDLEENIRKYRPDYVVHGTDWQDGALSGARQRTIDILSEWGGKLVEPEYTQGISSSIAHLHLRDIGITPSVRTARLRKLLSIKPNLRGISVHDVMSAMIVEKSAVKQVGRPMAEFDFFYIDGEVSATVKGKSNAIDIDFSEKKTLINEIFEVTTKPLLYDGSSIVEKTQVERHVKLLESAGASGIVLWNEDVEILSELLKQAKHSQLESDFMVFPKISLDVASGNMEVLRSNIEELLASFCDGIVFESKNIDVESFNRLVGEIKETKAKLSVIVVLDADSDVDKYKILDCDSLIYKNHLITNITKAIEATTNAILS